LLFINTCDKKVGRKERTSKGNNMSEVLEQYMLFGTIVIIVACVLSYKIGYRHGNKYDRLLLSSFKANSTYEVLAFCVIDEESDEHGMFLRNMNNISPLALVRGHALAYKWSVGDIIMTNEKKEISSTVMKT
jgi:hypothetical protein